MYITKHAIFLGPKPECPKAKHTYKVNVWGGISWTGPSPLAYFKVNMEAKLYCGILEKVYVPYAQKAWPQGL